MTTHDEAFAAALDRIPTLKADDFLRMTADEMLWQINMAAEPGSRAPQYREATRKAIAYAHMAFRHIIALDSREQLRKLMAQAAQRPDRVRGIPQPDDTRSVLGRSWTGD